MKALFIGGTGTISSAIAKLALHRDWEIYLLNRGNRMDRVAEGAKLLTADIEDESKVSELIKDMKFDVVADFIAFLPSQVERDIRLFKNKTKQYIFISSASAYDGTILKHKITESTPLSNPMWKYSSDKIACEDLLTAEMRKNGFPMTIVRPSHTYDERTIPLDVLGKSAWQVIDRILKGKQVILHGDGTSLWTLTHSSDFAKAFVGLMGNHMAIGEAFQITSDEALTWNEIYDCIGNALNVEVKKFHAATDFLVELKPGFKGPFLSDKSNNACFDNSKIKKFVPDYVATLRFDQGVRLCIDYMLSHPEVQVADEEFDRFCDNIIKVQQDAVVSFKKIDN